MYRNCYVVVDVLVVVELIHCRANLCTWHYSVLLRHVSLLEWSAIKRTPPLLCLWMQQDSYEILPFVLLSHGSLHPILFVILSFAQSENLYLEFLDTHLSLAPTHVRPSVRPLVRPLVRDTFGFPICQRLWSPYVKNLFDPKLTQPKLFQIERTRWSACLPSFCELVLWEIGRGSQKRVPF